MQVIAKAHQRSDSAIKSFTLADFAPPPIPRARRRTWADFSIAARALHLAKAGLTAWGIVSLGAAAGMGLYYSSDYSSAARQTPLLASASPHAAAEAQQPPAQIAAAAPLTPPKTPQPEAPTAPSGSARERLAILMDAPSPLTLAPPPPKLAEALTLKAASPTVEARVPRARPDEPIFTGSISRAPAEPPVVAPPRRRILDPCAALKKIRAPFLFGNRCGRHTRAYPPATEQVEQAAAPVPAREHAPRPYQPPVRREN
jgi:hypothetical protein